MYSKGRWSFARLATLAASIVLLINPLSPTVAAALNTSAPAPRHPPPGHARPRQVQVLDDDFHRSAGDNNVGNQWVDPTHFIWRLGHHELHAFAAGDRYHQLLLRPPSEAMRNGRIVIHYVQPRHGYPAPLLYALLRVQPDGEAYAAYASTPTELRIVRLRGGNRDETFPLQRQSLVKLDHAIPPGAAVILDFQAISFDARRTNLTALIFVPAISSHALGTARVIEDHFPILQQPGAQGMTNYYAATVTRVTTYNEQPGRAQAVTFDGPADGVQHTASSDFIASIFPAGALSSALQIIPSDSGLGGRFLPARATLSTQHQQAHFVYIPPHPGLGRISLRIRGSLHPPRGLQFRISAAPLVLGTQRGRAISTSAVVVKVQGVHGGTGKLLYQWYRSKVAGFHPDRATAISNATGLVFHDAGLHVSTLYFYKLSVRDSQGLTDITPELPVSTDPQPHLPNLQGAQHHTQSSPLAIGFLGTDVSLPSTSRKPSTNPEAVSIHDIGLVVTGAPVTVVNASAAGSKTTDWLPTIPDYFYAHALKRFLAKHVTWVMLSLGVNDARRMFRVSPDVYRKNLRAILRGLTGSGMKVILNVPTYTRPGTFNGQFDDYTTYLLQRYAAELPTLADNKRVFMGDRVAFEYTATHPQSLSDGVHASADGTHAIAKLWAAGFLHAAFGFSFPPR